MPLPTYDERAPSRPKPRRLVGNNSSVNRMEIPPPHLHHSSQLYLQPALDNNRPTSVENYQTGTLGSVSGQGSAEREDHFDHFVSEHEIKFTRSEVCTPSTCICFFIAFLFSFMAIMSGIYYGQRMFKVQFVLFEQNLPLANLENAESSEFKTLSWSLKRQMDALFKESSLARAYIKSEIVAFEKKTNKPSEVVVHLNVHVTGTKRNVETSEVYLVLADEIANKRLKVFEKWNIEHNSLDVQERKWPPREKSSMLVNPWTYKAIFPGMLENLPTQPTPAPRKCLPLGLQYCSFLSYNRTSYPNALQHWNLSSVEDEFIQYKEIIDSECSIQSAEFLCTLLQPECVDDEIILPCTSFCNEFINSCHRWLPDKIASKIVCSTLPDGMPRANQKAPRCRGKPNCAATLRLQSQERKVCDRIRDCLDESDELNCQPCQEGKHLNCPDRQCTDSPCFTLLPHTGAPIEKAYGLSKGYLLASFKGRDSWLCSESSLVHMQNYSHMYYNNQLQILGLNICNEMHFEELLQIASKHVTISGPFSKFVPGTTLISPYSSQCKGGEIYYVECAISKCGINGPLAYEEGAVDRHGSSKALPGYWPWFAKINLNGNYFCDGTLLSPDTALAQGACFSPEGNYLDSQNLSVTLGSVRFHKDNIEARRLGVSQVTPLNRRMAYLLKLTTRSNTTQYTRPVCHKPDTLNWTSNMTSLQCVLLSLNYESDQLQWRKVSIVAIERCHQSMNQTNTQFAWSSEQQREQRKLCVDLGNLTNFSLPGGPCINQINSEDCLGYGSTGRPLYCRLKSRWHLFALQMPPSEGTSIKSGHFKLFETLPQLNV